MLYEVITDWKAVNVETGSNPGAPRSAPTSAGSIAIGGKDVTHMDPAARGVSMVFQSVITSYSIHYTKLYDSPRISSR